MRWHRTSLYGYPNAPCILAPAGCPLRIASCNVDREPGHRWPEGCFCEEALHKLRIACGTLWSSIFVRRQAHLPSILGSRDCKFCLACLREPAWLDAIIPAGSVSEGGGISAPLSLCFTSLPDAVAQARITSRTKRCDPLGKDQAAYALSWPLLALEVESPDGDICGFLQTSLERFCRSLLLSCILAFMRLLVTGISFQSRQPRRNLVLRRARTCLSGVPLILALAFTLPFAQAMAPTADIHATVGDSPPHGRGAVTCAPEGAASMPTGRIRPSTAFVEGDERLPCTAQDASVIGNSDTDSPADTYRPPEHNRCFNFGVQVLHYQRQTRWFVADSAEVSSVEDLVELAEDELDAYQHCSMIVPVFPQPHSRVPVLLEVPLVADLLGYVPVCVQVHLPGLRYRFWFDYVMQDLRMSDLIYELADGWPPGARVLVGDRHRYLGEDEVIRLRPGELIKVLTPGVSCPRHVTLCAKLQQPRLHLDSLEEHGFYDDSFAPNHHCVLQILEAARLVEHVPVSPGSLIVALLQSAPPRQGSVNLHWAPMYSPSPVVRGILVASVAAIIPRTMVERVHVFIDPRPICQPVRVVASKQGMMPFNVFLHHIGMAVPWPDHLVVDGTVQFNPLNRVINVRQGDKVVLYYTHEAQQRLQTDLRECNSRTVLTDAARPATAAGSGSRGPVTSATSMPRERTPRREVSSTQPTDGSDPAMTTTQSALCAGMRNHVSTHDVPSLHPPGDASAVPHRPLLTCVYTTYLVLQDHLEALAHAPVVYQGAELLMPDTALALDAQDDGVGDDGTDPGDTSPAPSPVSSVFPSRIVVHVYTFQGPTRKHFLWAAHEEDLDSFLVRASILLNDDPDFVQLIPVRPQPPEPFFALLMCPRWWSDSGTCPLLCVTDEASRTPFFHTAHGDLDLEDILPGFLFGHGARLDVYVPPERAGAPFVSPAKMRPAYDMCPGDLLLFQREGRPAPIYAEPVEHLRALQHVEADPLLIATDHAPGNLDAVLLGTQFEQHLLVLRPGSVIEQAASLLGVDRSALFIHRQHTRFNQLVVGGKDVLHCFGFRLLTIHGGRMAGRGLFCDGRATGRPVAYRRVLQKHIDASDMCRILDVRVPPSYRPLCLGDRIETATSEPFEVMDGDTVVLWLDLISPVALPSPETAEESDRLPDTTDEDGPTDRSVNAGRSRSPRRGTTTDRPLLDKCHTEGQRTDQSLSLPVDDVRQLPTPARALIRLPALQDTAKGAEVLVARPTLLEAATCHVDLPGLLTVLCAKADTSSLLHPQLPLPVECPAPPTVPPRCAISLQTSLQISDFQQSVLDLRALLAERLQCNTQDDWLDADLAYLRASRYVPYDVRCRCRELRTWWEAVDVELLAFRIFTDGSADPEPAASQLTSAAWAFCVFADTTNGPFYVGHSAYPTAATDSLFFVGERSEDALTAELLALLWALAWVADSGHRFKVPIYLGYDCTAAGGGTFGHSLPAGLGGSAKIEVGQLSHAVVLMRQLACSQAHVVDSHVAGHSGILGNEIADCLAKRATSFRLQDGDRVLPLWPAKLLKHELREWAWAADVSVPDLPSLYALESEASRLQQETRPAPPPPAPGARSTEPESVELSLTLLSYNALTLLDAPGAAAQPAVGLKVFGRRDVIKQQLRHAQVVFAGLQETRIRQACIAPDPHFIMLQAPATEAGTHGVALWISKEFPLARQQTRSLFVRQQDVTVVDASPRHLLACIHVESVRLTVLVAHAPYDVPGRCEAEAFWSSMSAVLERPGVSGPMIILTDANARVGSVQTCAIGEVSPDVESPAGAALHNLLLRHELCLPCTFPSCQVGPTPTWTSPHGLRSRIDFIALPDSWRDAATAWVWTNFEALQRREDHEPVVVRCQLQRQLTVQPYNVVVRRCPLRPDTRWTAAARQLLLESFQAEPAVPWHIDVDRHFDAWVAAWQTSWDALAPGVDSKPLQVYLTSSTLSVVHQRKALRAYIADEEAEMRRQLLMLGMASFRLLRTAHVDGRRLADRLAAIRGAVHWSIARAVGLLRATTKQVRALVKADRLRYLEQVQSEITLHDLRDPRRLYMAVRRAFPATQTKRRSKFVPLPQVRMPDGSYAQSNEQRMLCWHQHFSDLESGTTIEPTEYAACFAKQDLCTPRNAPVFELSAVPTLAAMETVVLQLRRGRASGVDGVTAELLQLNAAATTRSLFPVTLKAALSTREPTAYRGGHLAILAKKAFAAVECHDFRAILLSSVPGKVHHRLLRQQLAPYLARVKSDLQCGALPGVGTECLLLFARTLQEMSRAHKKRAAFLLFDIRAAFYRLVRQLVAPIAEDERDFLALLDSLQLPPTALQELQQHLQNMAAIPACGAGPHLTALVGDLFRGTWFHLDKGVALSLTRRGSRPGDPTADLIYGFSLSALHASMDSALETRHLLPVLPCPCQPPLLNHAIVQRSLGAASWADDCMRHVEADTLPELLTVVSQTLQVCFERATSMGVQFSQGPAKTAILVSDPPRGQRLPGVQLPLPVSLQVPNALTGSNDDVALVSAYKYLGGVVTTDGCPRVEIQHRLAQAAGVAKPLRRKLFGNRSFCLQVRRTLLRTLSVSKYVYGSTALILHTGVHQRQWHRGYVSLWRALLPSQTPSGHGPGSYHVLHAADAPVPALALAYSRAAFLRRLYLFGPATVAHALQRHWEDDPKRSWLGLLRDDIQVVAQYVEAASILLGEHCPVRALCDSVLADCNWWVRTVRKAVNLCRMDIARFVSCQPAVPAVMPAVSAAASMPFACTYCDARFRLRKHLGTHFLRCHGIMSPARHYAVAPYCVSCHRWYHDVKRVQQHLKLAPRCLERAAQVVPPLCQSQILALEASSKERATALSKGRWSCFAAAAPATAFYGPRLPSRQERLPNGDESLLLSELTQGFCPKPADLLWIRNYLQQASVEGPREASAGFWSRQTLLQGASSNLVSPACPNFGTQL